MGVGFLVLLTPDSCSLFSEETPFGASASKGMKTGIGCWGRFLVLLTPDS
jgi:hypothetical protein